MSLLILTLATWGFVANFQDGANSIQVELDADSRKIEELAKQVGQLWRKDQFAEASKKAEELVLVLQKKYGPNDYRVKQENLAIKTIQHLQTKSPKDRADYWKANDAQIEGRRLQNQNQYQQADKLFREALEINLRVLGKAQPHTVTSYYLLGSNLDFQGKYREAESVVREALKIGRHYFDEDDPFLPSLYENVALNLRSQGRYGEAEPVFRKALEIRRAVLGESDPNTATSYDNLARDLIGQGKYEQAGQLLDQSLEITRSVFGEDDAETATSYHNIGLNFFSQRKHEQAREYFLKGLAIRRRILDKNHLDLAHSYTAIASTWIGQEKYDQTEDLLLKALEICRGALGEQHPLTAASHRNLAENFHAQGQHQRAEKPFREALRLYKEILGNDHPNAVLSSNGLAINLNAQSRYQEAQALWSETLGFYEQNRLRVSFSGLDRTPFDTKNSPRLALSAMSLRLKKPESKVKVDSDAWRFFENELGRGLLEEIFDRSGARLNSEEQSRLETLRTEMELLDRWFDSHATDSKKQVDSQVLENLRKRRAKATIEYQTFQSQIAQKYGFFDAKPKTLEEIQAVLPDDVALIGWLDFGPSTPHDADSDGVHWALIVRSKGGPRWIELKGSGPGQVWTDQDQKLSSLLHQTISLPPMQRQSSWVRYAQTLRSLRLEPLKPALKAQPEGLPPVRRLVVLPSPQMLKIPLEILGDDSDPWSISYAPSGTILAHLRSQPKQSLENQKGLLALGDPIFERQSTNKPPVLPEHGLLIRSVVPGSTAAIAKLKVGDVLLACDKQRLEKTVDLQQAVGKTKAAQMELEIWRGEQAQTATMQVSRGRLGVVFDPDPAPVALRRDRAFRSLLDGSRSGPNLTPLPGTRYEVHHLGQLFQAAKLTADVFTDSNASEQQLHSLAKSGDLAKYRFIHLATHGSVDDQTPARSAIYLSRDRLPDPLSQVLEKLQPFDGQVQVREIQHDWNIQADMVTLSACETGLGRISQGDGFVGFTQALLLAGAKSVCLSLWKVDDSATALLMERFYSNLLGARPELNGKPMGKSEALNEAKHWLRTLKHVEAEKQLERLVRATRSKDAALKLRPGLKAPDPLRTESGVNHSDQPYADPYYWAAFILIGDFE